jgi:hypothetical protein
MEVIYNDLKENPSSNSISYKALNKPKKPALGQGLSKHGLTFSPRAFVTHTNTMSYCAIFNHTLKNDSPFCFDFCSALSKVYSKSPVL